MNKFNILSKLISIILIFNLFIFIRPYYSFGKSLNKPLDSNIEKTDIEQINYYPGMSLKDQFDELNKI